MNKLIFISRFLFLVAIPLVITSNISASASVIGGSHCTEKQYNTDVTIKSGKKIYLCTGAPDGYYWTELGKGGGSAHVSNSKSSAKYPSSAAPSAINNYTVVPPVIGMSSVNAQQLLRLFFLSSSHHYAYEYNGGSSADCAMQGNPVVIAQRPFPGAKVFRNSQVIYITNC